METTTAKGRVLPFGKSTPCYEPLTSFFACLHDNATHIGECQPQFTALRECEASIPERTGLWERVMGRINGQDKEEEEVKITREPGALSSAVRAALPQVFLDEDDVEKKQTGLTKAARAVAPQLFNEDDDVEKEEGLLTNITRKALPQVFNEDAPRKQTFLSRGLQKLAPQIFKEEDDDDDDDDDADKKEKDEDDNKDTK